MPNEPLPPVEFNPATMHKHKCPICGFVWAHEDQCGGVEGAHNCPVPGCSGYETFRLQDDAAAPVVSCFAPPPADVAPKLKPRVGDVYKRGSDVRTFQGINDVGAVRYTRPDGHTSRRHYTRKLKLATWLRWAAKAQLIRRGPKR